MITGRVRGINIVVSGSLKGQPQPVLSNASFGYMSLTGISLLSAYRGEAERTTTSSVLSRLLPEAELNQRTTVSTVCGS